MGAMKTALICAEDFLRHQDNGDTASAEACWEALVDVHEPQASNRAEAHDRACDFLDYVLRAQREGAI